MLRGDSRGVLSDALLAQARRHRVDRLLPRPRAQTCADALIDELAVRELCAVLVDLEAAGLDPLVFKGAALAHTHYAESWMRPRLDADVLIAPERRDEAIRLLRRRGYEQPPVVSGDLISYQAMFVKPAEAGGEHVLDLHWRIANTHLVAHALSHAELVARAERILVRGHVMRVPSAVDALLIACVHRAAHHADAPDLIWLYDIHVIAARMTGGEWSRFVDLAAERQLATLCARGLSLAAAAFHIDIPDHVSGRLSARIEPSAILLKPGLRPIDRLAADLRSMGLRRATRLLREHLFPPVSYVRAKYDVSAGALLPAFYAYRIVAGASKWLRAIR